MLGRRPMDRGGDSRVGVDVELSEPPARGPVIGCCEYGLFHRKPGECIIAMFLIG